MADSKKIITKSNNKTEMNGDSSEKSNGSLLNIFSNKHAKTPILFVAQTVLIFTVVIAALINLSINSHDDPNSKLWIMLLSGCVGYFLPNPSIKLLPKT